MKKILPIFLLLVMFLVGLVFASTFQTSVITSTDDAWYYSTGWSTMGINVTLGNYEGNSRQSSFRFQDVTIPQGSTIDSAFLFTKARLSSSTNKVNVKFYGEDTASASTFSTNTDYLARAKTTTSVSWQQIGGWIADEWYVSPDISDIIQEIIDRWDWVSGNDLVIFIEDSSSTAGAYRIGRSYDYNGEDDAPYILIYYTYTPGGTSDSVAVDTGSGWNQWIYPAYLKKGTNITFDLAGDTLTISGEAGGSGGLDSGEVMQIVRDTTYIDSALTGVVARDTILPLVSDSGDALRAEMPDSAVFRWANSDTTNVGSGYCWMWNGSQAIWAPCDTTFVFSVESFSDGEATTQLIGSGVWESAGNISFTASYANPPPTFAYIKISSNGGVSWAESLELSSPYTSGVSAENTNYPSAKDQYNRFQLFAVKGAETDNQYETAIYFRNYGFYGAIAKASGFTESDIEGLSSAYATSSNLSTTINAGAGEYIVWAFPTSYTALDEGDDYEDDGGTDFKFNSFAIAMTQDNSNLSITNSAGYTEGYDVYVSNLANLGNHTFVANTLDQTINYLYYGITTDASGYDEADIEGLANSTITNDNTQVWSSVTAGGGEYLLFAFPKRLGLVTFWVGGFEGGFESPEEVSVTNANGWTEDYYAWRSTNSGLGETVVETKAP